MPAATPLEHSTLRAVLGRFCTGVTVVSTAQDGAVHAMTANAFTSVSLEPPLVLVSIDRRAKMHKLLPDTERYGVSVLGAGQEEVARHFAGRPMAEPGELFEDRDGVPLLTGAIAHVSCRLYAAHEAGDHTLYLGRVEYLDSLPGDPLVFTSGRFGRLAGAELDHLSGW
jgi:flavin reductase (DIM6/NTAB) family NADH-FMN oxidoreductase RutF